MPTGIASFGMIVTAPQGGHPSAPSPATVIAQCVGSSPAAVVTPSPGAAGACSAVASSTASGSAWTNGDGTKSQQYGVTVLNAGTESMTSVVLTLTTDPHIAPVGGSVSQIWNAVLVSGTVSQYTLPAISASSPLAVGASTTFGLIITSPASGYPFMNDIAFSNYLCNSH